MQIIGITGTNGAGKGTIVKRLKELHPDWAHYSVRELIEENLKLQTLPTDRAHMIIMGNRLRKKDGAYFVKEYVKRAKQNSVTTVIIESIRTMAEVNFIMSLNGILVAVDAKPEIRYERVSTNRRSSTDKGNYEQFVADEHAESISRNPSEQNLIACVMNATVCFSNNRTPEDLYKEVDAFFAEFPKLSTATI